MRFQGTAYRAHNPKWAWQPDSGEGARRHGGRFNRKGLPALYLALSPLTAIREVSQLGRPLQPVTLVAYDVDMEPVVDTRDPDQCIKYGIQEDELVCPNWRFEMLEGRIPASQHLADRLIGAGVAGMVYRSFAPLAGPDDINLVCWTWGTAAPARVVVINQDNRLPMNPSSWPDRDE